MPETTLVNGRTPEQIAAREGSRIRCGPGRTKQSFADESDINKLLANYQRTGQLTNVMNVLPQYGDFSNVDDYATALMKVTEAQRLFDTLPAKIRSRVNNDPGAFIDFVADPDNAEELIEMGLADRPLGQPPEPPAPPPKEEEPPAPPEEN